MYMQNILANEEYASVVTSSIENMLFQGDLPKYCDRLHTEKATSHQVEILKKSRYEDIGMPILSYVF